LEEFHHFKGDEEGNRNEVLQQDEPLEERSKEKVPIRLSIIIEQVGQCFLILGRKDHVDQRAQETHTQLNRDNDDDVQVRLQFDFTLLDACFERVLHHFGLMACVARNTVNVICIAEN
jgi:hypothetical protein